MIVLAKRRNIMAITDKTRKILWGRSGNAVPYVKANWSWMHYRRRRICCWGRMSHHLISSLRPRYDDSFPQEKIDTYQNLILLCRVHHKMVDDQDESFTVNILRQMKANHELLVSHRLADALSRSHQISQNQTEHPCIPGSTYNGRRSSVL